jgi:hypothetical protein
MQLFAAVLALFVVCAGAQGACAPPLLSPTYLVGFQHIQDMRVLSELFACGGAADARPVLFTTDINVDGKALPLVVHEVGTLLPRRCARSGAAGRSACFFVLRAQRRGAVGGRWWRTVRRGTRRWRSRSLSAHSTTLAPTPSTPSPSTSCPRPASS